MSSVSFYMNSNGEEVIFDLDNLGSIHGEGLVEWSANYEILVGEDEGPSCLVYD